MIARSFIAVLRENIPSWSPMKKYFLSITTAILFFWGAFARAEPESSRETDRVRLVFSIDQGFGNGVAANGGFWGQLCKR